MNQMTFTATMTLRDHIEQRHTFFRNVGHPNLLDAFLTRNAALQRGEPLPKGVKRMQMKQCFANAAQLSLERDWFYVEGYAASAQLGIPLHHAWNVTPDGKLVDVTWRFPETAQYFGVPFNTEDLSRWLLKQKYYGLLDSGKGLSVELMLSMDPQLVEVVPQLKGWKL